MATGAIDVTVSGDASVESTSCWWVEMSKVYDVVAPAFPLRSDVLWVERSW
jgi:hypothetical protein